MEITLQRIIDQFNERNSQEGISVVELDLSVLNREPVIILPTEEP